MSDIQPRIRCGDHVHHGPSGETWVVAFADYERDEIAWCGWPEGFSTLSNCTLIKSATDEVSRKLARQIVDADPNDLRGRGVRRCHPELLAELPKAEGDETEAVKVVCHGSKDDGGPDIGRSGEDFALGILRTRVLERDERAEKVDGKPVEGQEELIEVPLWALRLICFGKPVSKPAGELATGGARA